MNLLRLALVLFCVSCNGSAVAGAWDVGPFENDDALDWVWELESSSGFAVLESALATAANRPSYLEAPDGSIAVAAAEVVAALLGNPQPQLPEEVINWIRGKNLEADSDLVVAARKAVAAVQDIERSELAQLWSDSEDTFAAWQSSLADLANRLK